MIEKLKLTNLSWDILEAEAIENTRNISTIP